MESNQIENNNKKNNFKDKNIYNNMNNEKEKENLLNNFNILINKEDITYEKENKDYKESED